MKKPSAEDVMLYDYASALKDIFSFDKDEAICIDGIMQLQKTTKRAKTSTRKTQTSPKSSSITVKKRGRPLGSKNKKTVAAQAKPSTTLPAQEPPEWADICNYVKSQYAGKGFPFLYDYSPRSNTDFRAARGIKKWINISSYTSSDIWEYMDGRSKRSVYLHWQKHGTLDKSKIDAFEDFTVYRKTSKSMWAPAKVASRRKNTTSLVGSHWVSGW